MKVTDKTGLVSVEIVQDSFNECQNSRITTLILEYPRIIHSELMTHRLFSRNASSSRAIPIMSTIKQVWVNPALPVRFGKNQAGMQDCGEYKWTGVNKFLWKVSSKVSCGFAYLMTKLNIHKQVANRILEPYQFIRVCLTSTNWNNWFALRNHTDADPTIHALASLMYTEMKRSTPVKLGFRHWHIPFVKTVVNSKGDQEFYDENDLRLTLEQALKVSTSCCAQTSYRKLDASVEKAERVYERLVESKPVHASPTEHQAQALSNFGCDWKSVPGLTHEDKNSVLWSGNLHGYIQYRQLIKENAEYY